MASSAQWASLVAQSIKNLPAIQETQVRFLGWEDPLENEMVTHSSISAWKNPMDKGSLVGCSPWVTKSQDVSQKLSMHMNYEIEKE